MRFLTISKLLLILILPFLLFLLAMNFVGFDKLFYQQKFTEYEVQQNVPQAALMHEKVINFIKGKNNELPNKFNEREKQHLLDVRNVIRLSKSLLYTLIFVFIMLLTSSAFILKVNNKIVNFVGKMLIYGGFLTIFLALILFIFINTNFSSTFELFHSLLFKPGTYTFDPAEEMLVNLYPEQIFMDLGLRISKLVIITSVILIILGVFLLFIRKK